MRKKFKIIFMGTPDFAVPALNILNKKGYDVSLVVTQPDRPKGRGRKIVPPPVKEVAIRLGYNVFQPVSIRTREFADLIANHKPDISPAHPDANSNHTGQDISHSPFFELAKEVARSPTILVLRKRTISINC